jgi:DNA-binding GntR family transcriptional regulator
MKHYSLKESAYRIIKEKLLNCEFEPGSRFREDLIAEEISMSRTPVREAINQLVTEGLVRNVPRKGLFVIELTPEWIADLVDVREVLERLAVEKCIERIDDEGVQRLGEIVHAIEENFAQENFKECNELDGVFHQEIASLAANIKLVKFLKEIEDFMHIARAMEKRVMARERVEISLKEHREIFAAIERRDRRGAVEAVIRNIETLKKNLGV